jgi:thiol-disulfide isomerase/thioredoxin
MTMSVLRTIGLAFSNLIFCAACWADDSSTSLTSRPAIGSKVAELRFVDIRSLERDLKELGDHRAFVFMATNTTCPLVRKYLPKLKQLQAAFADQDVLFVALNVGATDTIREMASQAIEFDLPVYFVKDADGSCVKRLGLRKTPEVVVLDRDHTLRYRGRIDDQLRIGGTKPQASREDLKAALTELLSDQPIQVTQTEVDGCLIEVATAAVPTSTVSTWSGDIASLAFQKCAHCHRPNTAAPFPLLTRDDFAANASMITEVLKNETMPPWYAARQHGQFQNDSGLTADQKQMLITWIAAGLPEGDSTKVPSPPTPPDSEWRIGKPDLIITMKEEHSVPATGFVPYKYVMLPHLFLWETWVEAFEIKPLNPTIVHHCNLAYITKDGAGDNTFITGYVPGGQPMDLGKFDNGVAYKIPAGAVLGLQIHYTTTGTEQAGKIQVGLRFPRREVRKQLHHFVLDPRGWEIPPGDPAFRIESSHTLKHNANLLGLFTHMHVRGRDMTFYADVENQQPETLLQIPNYNFEWQLGYEIAPGYKNLAKGTKIRAVAHFDNSPFNPYNPDPKVPVLYGPQTVDEMFNGFAFYVDNDEDLHITVNPKNGSVKAK